MPLPRAFRKLASALGRGMDREETVVISTVKDDHFLQLCLYAVFSTPWIELIGLCLGLGTTWYLRRKAGNRGHANREDEGSGGKRMALSERVARGLPVLVTTGLWQALVKYGGQKSRLDPVICILAWLLLDVLMSYIPQAAWDAADLGSVTDEHKLISMRHNSGSRSNGGLVGRQRGAAAQQRSRGWWWARSEHPNPPPEQRRGGAARGGSLGGSVGAPLRGEGGHDWMANAAAAASTGEYDLTSSGRRRKGRGGGGGTVWDSEQSPAHVNGNSNRGSDDGGGRNGDRNDRNESSTRPYVSGLRRSEATGAVAGWFAMMEWPRQQREEFGYIERISSPSNHGQTVDRDGSGQYDVKSCSPYDHVASGGDVGANPVAEPARTDSHHYVNNIDNHAGEGAGNARRDTFRRLSRTARERWQQQQQQQQQQQRQQHINDGYPGRGGPGGGASRAASNNAANTPSPAYRPANKRPRAFSGWRGKIPVRAPAVSTSTVSADHDADASCDDHFSPPPPPSPPSTPLQESPAVETAEAAGECFDDARDYNTPENSTVEGDTPASRAGRTSSTQEVGGGNMTPGDGDTRTTPRSDGVRLTPGSGISLNSAPISEGAASIERTFPHTSGDGGGGYNGQHTGEGGGGSTALRMSLSRTSSRRRLRRPRAASYSSIAYNNKQRFESLRSAKDASSWAAAVTGVITKRPRGSTGSAGVVYGSDRAGAGGAAAASSARDGPLFGTMMRSFSSPLAKKGRTMLMRHPDGIEEEISGGRTSGSISGGRPSGSISAGSTGNSGGGVRGGGHGGVPTGVAIHSNAAVPGVGEPLFCSPSAGDGVSGDGEEEGTAIPAGFRPQGKEDDVLCEWKLEYLRKDEDLGMFAQGTFGKVMAAKTESGRNLAVKIMEKSESSPERYIARELKLLQECSVHPHVVGLLGVIKTAEKVYVLMPLADSDVAAMIKSSTRLNEKQASYVIRQVLSAVEFLHARNIVHRDIKPANLLVLSNKLLLADFGLAKRMEPGQHAMTGACGTKPYLAPELVRDLHYDETVDLWAIGVVTYELLHGYTPFRPVMKRARSWDGLMPELRATPRSSSSFSSPARVTSPSSSNSPTAAPCAGRSPHNIKTTLNGYSSAASASVSESSGSIVSGRMFERSAPAAPGAGLDRAWLAGQAAHLALLRGQGRGGMVMGAGWGLGADGAGDDDVDEGAWRRGGNRAADHMKMLDNIARGRFSFQDEVVGKDGRDFISMLLQQCPSRRLSAARGVEHSWITGANPSKVPPRRRAARGEVAAVTAERASSTAERYAVHVRRMHQLNQDQQGVANVTARTKVASVGTPGRGSRAAAEYIDGVDRERERVEFGSSEDMFWIGTGAASTAATVTTLTEIANLAKMMSAECRSAAEDATRLDKKANAAAVSTAAAAASANKAEAAVCRAEAFAQEAEAGATAAAEAFGAWQRQEEFRTATAAAAVDGGWPRTPAGAKMEEEEKAHSDDIWATRFTSESAPQQQ